ncbi:MAG: DUF1501 domain-containing protein [Planctomycetota bacterium]
MPISTNSRRAFLSNSLSSVAGATLATNLLAQAKGQETAVNPEQAKARPKGKAEHCILIWLGGGACQVDTFDPKRVGDPKSRKPGSAYPAIDTAIEGTQLCEHLSNCAKVLDRFNIVRTCNHDGVPDHGAATNFVHTGRKTTGTITYPSIGSLITHARGPIHDEVPAYVLIGYPNVSRGPGFLGPKAGYVYLTDTDSGPSSFTRPESVSKTRQSRREELLNRLKAGYVEENAASAAIQDYDLAIEEALRLSGPGFQKVFSLSYESDDLRNSYGSEFGQRCLLARRLCQSGARFVEVSHNLNFVNGSGWDTHRQGQLKQHLLIQDLDRALATLVIDLEAQRMLDKTLVVVATEFGRPSGWDGGGGRNHQTEAFSMVLAGGGLRNGITIGATDELGKKIVDRPVSIPDFHATIAYAMGVDPSEELFAGDRPVPLTDHGRPIRELF